MKPIIKKIVFETSFLYKRVLFGLGLLLLSQNAEAFVNSRFGVKFSSFSAVVSAGQIKLQWSTQQETDNKFFMIERSSNAIDFVLVDTLGGTGTTNQRVDYCLFDENPVVGISYYRITQVDCNYSQSMSNIIDVEYIPEKNNCDISMASIYPVPFNDQFSVNINCIKDTKLNIEIRGEVGKKVFDDNACCIIGKNTLVFNELSQFNDGVYFILISDQQGCKLSFTLLKKGK